VFEKLVFDERLLTIKQHHPNLNELLTALQPEGYVEPVDVPNEIRQEIVADTRAMLGYLHLLVPLGDSAGSAFGDLELSDGSKLKVLSPPQGSASKELEDRLWREQQVYKDDLFADSGDDIPRTFVYLEYSARARLPLAVSYDKQRLLERI